MNRKKRKASVNVTGTGTFS